MDCSLKHVKTLVTATRTEMFWYNESNILRLSTNLGHLKGPFSFFQWDSYGSSFGEYMHMNDVKLPSVCL